MSHLLANRLLASGGAVLDVLSITDGQVLVRSGNTITSQASTSGRTVAASGSFPAAATLDVTDIAQTGAKLIVGAIGASSNTATRLPWLRLSNGTGGTPTFDTTAGNYLLQHIVATTVGSGTSATLIDGMTAVGAAGTWDFTVAIDNYQGSSSLSYPIWYGNVRSSTPERTFATGMWLGGPVRAVRYLWNGSGNFDAGTYEVVLEN